MNLFKLMNLVIFNLKSRSARANILRLALMLVVIIFIIIFITNLTYKASVCIQLPAGKEKSGAHKISGAGEFKLIQSHEVIKSALKNALHLSGTREIKLESSMTAKIKRNLYYKYDKESMIFELEYFERSGEYAVKIANALAEAYIYDYSFRLNDFTSKTLQMLYMKQLETEKALSSSIVRYDKFCAAENILNIENDYLSLTAQYARHNEELSRLNTEISIAEKLAERNLTYKPKSSPAAGEAAENYGGRAGAASVRMEDSEENYELKKKIRDTEIKLAVLKKKYTQAHPLVKNESMLLDILKNKITYMDGRAAAAEKHFKQAPAFSGKNEQAIDTLKTKRTAYLNLINECDAGIKAFPRKRAQVKSYEVEIAKLENLLSVINKQIDDTRISQAGLSENMPRIIESSAAARLNIDYFSLAGAFISLVIFIMSFKFENKAQLIKESKKMSDYKSLVIDDFKYKVLGHINKSERLNFEDSSFSAACFAYHQKDSRQAKYVNIIRSNIAGQLDKNTGNAAGLTSLNPSEGKTVLASNIGISSALSGQPTLVIDLNYKTTCPPVSDYYKIGNQNGLTDILVGETPYEEVIAGTAIDDLKIIPTGILPPNVQKVMSSDVFGEFIKSVSANFGLVIADCPAFSISGDFHAIAGYVKNIALIIDVDKISSADDFREELAAFDSFAKNSNLYVLGVIFNEK
jgi:capsular exopolysaccharide synthesis family protein